MQSVQQFLREHDLDYGDLSEAERAALNDFSLLWTAFEGSVLGPQYRIRDLLWIPETLSECGVLQTDTLAPQIAHFKNLYVQNGAYTPEFDGLRMKRATSAVKKMIREFLTTGPEHPVVGALQATLWIIKRLRDNTFYEARPFHVFRQKLASFQAAEPVLMFILTHHPLRH